MSPSPPRRVPLLDRLLRFVSAGTPAFLGHLRDRTRALLSGTSSTSHARRSPRPHPPFALHPFDRLWHTDTSGLEFAESLHSGPGSPSHRSLGASLWSTAYYGVPPSVFDRALALIHLPATPTSDPSTPADWSRFTFLDLGCGKGRALLLASRHPFRHILGVELDATLAAIAQNNLHSFRAPWQQCHSLEVQHADATLAPLPETPLLLYLYNPFHAPVLRRVLRRLERSLRENPRELWLVYINPEAAATLRRFPFLREHTRTILPIAAEDALPDRIGSSQEELAIFHFLPPT